MLVVTLPLRRPQIVIKALAPMPSLRPKQTHLLSVAPPTFLSSSTLTKYRIAIAARWRSTCVSCANRRTSLGHHVLLAFRPPHIRKIRLCSSRTGISPQRRQRIGLIGRHRTHTRPTTMDSTRPSRRHTNSMLAILPTILGSRLHKAIHTCSHHQVDLLLLALTLRTARIRT